MQLGRGRYQVNSLRWEITGKKKQMFLTNALRMSVILYIHNQLTSEQVVIHEKFLTHLLVCSSVRIIDILFVQIWNYILTVTKIWTEFKLVGFG